MARTRPRLARLLALLLLLQWGTAFAHCLRPLASARAGHSVEICGAEGLTTVLLDDEGRRPVRTSAAGYAVCPGCCGPAALEPPTPPPIASLVVWAGEAPVRSPVGSPVAPARAPPQQPRAPPAA